MEEEVKVVASEEVVEAPAPKKGASKKSLLIRNIVYSGLIFLMLFMPIFIDGEFAGLPVTLLFGEMPIYTIYMGYLGLMIEVDALVWVFLAVYLIFFAVSAANLGLSIAALFTDKLDKVRRIVSKITFIVSLVAVILLFVNQAPLMMYWFVEFGMLYPMLIWAVAGILQIVISKKTEKSL